MEFGKKNKLLKAYGKGLAEKIYRESKECTLPGYTFKKSFDEYLKLYLQPTGLLANLEPKEKNLVIESLAEGFLEKGLLTDAYELYIDSNPKKAKLIHKLLKFDL